MTQHQLCLHPQCLNTGPNWVAIAVSPISIPREGKVTPKIRTIGCLSFWQPVTFTSNTLGLHIEKQIKVIKVNQSYAIPKALQIATATKDISTASTNHKIKTVVVFLAGTWSFWSFCLRPAANDALRTPSHSHFISRLKLKYNKKSAFIESCEGQRKDYSCFWQVLDQIVYASFLMCESDVALWWVSRSHSEEPALQRLGRCKQKLTFWHNICK